MIRVVERKKIFLRICYRWNICVPPKFVDRATLFAGGAFGRWSPREWEQLPYQRDPGELLCPSCHTTVRLQGEDRCPRTRKRALARHQIRRHLVLRLPTPELWEIRSVVHKPVSLWSFYYSSLSWWRQPDALVLSQTRAAWVWCVVNDGPLSHPSQNNTSSEFAVETPPAPSLHRWGAAGNPLRCRSLWFSSSASCSELPQQLAKAQGQTGYVLAVTQGPRL